MAINIKPFPATTGPPSIFANLDQVAIWLKSFWANFSQVRIGKLSCLFTGTFTIAATATTITNPYLTKQSVVIFNALDVDAAKILIQGNGCYATEANRNDGTWTLTHNAVGGTGGNFIAAIIG